MASPLGGTTERPRVTWWLQRGRRGAAPDGAPGLARGPARRPAAGAPGCRGGGAAAPGAWTAPGVPARAPLAAAAAGSPGGASAAPEAGVRHGPRAEGCWLGPGRSPEG